MITVNSRSFRALSFCAVLGILVSGATSCSRERKSAERGFFINADNTAFGMDLYGRARGGSLYVPRSYTGERPFALLFALHGAGATGRALETLGFNEAAEEFEFIVAYPDGIGFRWDAPDDTPFMMSLILELSARFSVDPERIYLTGHSAGAIEAYELAVALPGQFAAVAPVAGLMTAGNAPEGHPPLSVLHVHAADDAEVPYQGAEEWGLCSVDDSVGYWRAVNERDSKAPAAAETSALGDGVFRTLWRGPRADTALVRFESGGHAWPQLATGLIVDFFYNHPARPARVSIGCGGGKLVTGNVGSLELEATIDSSQKATLVEYFANGAEVARSIRAPYSAAWDKPGRGCYRVSARVTLADGRAVRSTLNPTVIVAPDVLGPEGLRASSSSVENEELLPSAAVDGNPRTRWSSSWTDTESLTVDLGGSRKISGVTLAWEIAFGRAYAIELSTDGSAWERVFETREGDGGYDHVSFPARDARAVRLVGVKRGSEWGYSLWEFMVHAE